MRWSCVLVVACLGCSSSSTNDKQNASGVDGGNATGGSGGTAASGGTAGNGGSSGSAASGGSGGTGPLGGAAGTDGSGGSVVSCTTAEITINEVSTKSSASLTDEFVELHNPGGTATLSGYELRVLGPTTGLPMTIWAGASSTVIDEKGYYVVAGMNFDENADATLSNSQSIPEDGGLGLYLNGNLVDAVAWGSITTGHPFVEGQPAHNDGSPGTSMARSPDGEDCGDNVTDFSVTYRTPKASNP